VDLLLLSKQFSGQGTFHQQLDLNLGKKLVKCYIWSIVFCDAEKLTFRKVDQKYLESSETWCSRRID
jgi:hypothetical protein